MAAGGRSRRGRQRWRARRPGPLPAATAAWPVAGRGGDQRQPPGSAVRTNGISQPWRQGSTRNAFFGDPIKSGEEIAETEAKSNDSGGFQPLPEPVVPRVATVEQPGERAESDKQHGPDMQRREGEHREGAHQHREQGAARACEAGDPSGGADHAAWLIKAGWSRMAERRLLRPLLSACGCAAS